MDAAGILPTFQGCAIHDFWKSYLKYDCQHALCNAHLLRKLVFLHEQENQTWAKAMIDHLLAIKQAVANARVAQLQALPDTEKVFLIARYNRIVEEGYAERFRRSRGLGYRSCALGSRWNGRCRLGGGSAVRGGDQGGWRE
jgi:transposase